ncbi:MAG TPA: hypothetical protein VHE12_14405 [bacterium]|nr:hypothetical protein [bacterium]
MPTEKKVFGSFWVLVLVMLLARPVWAATIEVESDEDEPTGTPTVVISPAEKAPVEKVIPTSTPTPLPEPTLAPTAPPTVAPTSVTGEGTVGPEEKMGTQKPRPRVRVSDKVNFFSFVQAGYLVGDPTEVQGIGTVVGIGNVENFTVGQKSAVDIDAARYPVKKGDLFFVYRCDRSIQELHLGHLGFQVENLGLVEVIEVQKLRHLVVVKKSFKPFMAGDQVVPYENEVKRWKRAQIKKPLPDQPIRAYVAGLDGARGHFSASDHILITAGSKKGVVEGQKFSLFEVHQGEFDKEDLGIPTGVAQVLYCGPECSIATILTSHEPIEAGFQAVYRP